MTRFATAHAETFQVRKHRTAPTRASAVRDTLGRSNQALQARIAPPDRSTSPRTTGVIQAKLTIGQVDDPLEEEADRAADQVMHMRSPEVASTTSPPQVSRECAACETEEKKKLHMEPAGMPDAAGREVPASVCEVLRSPGQPLDDATGAYFEARFRHDFSQVRLHTDAGAEQSAREVNAHAYTVGHDIVFVAGRLAPRTHDGRKLLAHELAHVIQQESMPALSDCVQRQPAPQKPAKAPTYRDCTVETTGSGNPNQELERARAFASDLADAAIGALAKNDPSELYRTALARHFIAPKFEDRKDIIRAYRLIKGYLRPEKLRCAASKDDVAECQSNIEAGITEAFTTPLQDTVICPSFWNERLPCRAISLIHEAAHGVGIGNDTTHPPYRGSTDYPHLAKAPPKSVTTEDRRNNPDAYAHFAAHIGRETDTQCFGIPMLEPETIEIKGRD